LRERRDDFMPFAQRFLAELNKKYDFHKEFETRPLSAMREYQWPGNVRELKNQVERMVVMSSEDVITPDLLPFNNNILPGILSGDMDTSMNLKALRERFELRFIHLAYEKYGNVREAAASLDMDAATFVRKRKRYEGRYAVQK
jgi:DNA-binding NtrC family response regulator